MDILQQFAEHAISCLPDRSEHGLRDCTVCNELVPKVQQELEELKAAAAAAAQELVQRQANIVEETLGGADKKPRLCVGCDHTNTKLRCPLCRYPLCQRCVKSSGAHPHVVRVKDLPYEQLTDPINKYGHWDKAGKAIKVTAKTRTVTNKSPYGSQTWQETYYVDENGKEVQASFKETGRRPKRVLNRALKAGAEWTIAASEFTSTYFDLVS